MGGECCSGFWGGGSRDPSMAPVGPVDDDGMRIRSNILCSYRCLDKMPSHDCHPASDRTHDFRAATRNSRSCRISSRDTGGPFAQDTMGSS